MKHGINVVGFISLQAGLAGACRMNVAAMRSFMDVAENDFPKCMDAELNCPHPTNYHHFNPDHVKDFETDVAQAGFFKGRKNIAYWAWEVDDYIRPEWVSASKHYNQVWTPSNFCAQSFYGRLHCDVKVVPHYIYTRPFVHRARLNCKDRFTVLAAFDGKSGIDRKNPMGMIQVFKDAFPRKTESVSLILKCHAVGAAEMALIETEIRNDPRISLVCEYLTPGELHNLASNVDLLLSLHRSEGFGLHLAEAMSNCIPVLATGYGGNLDFMDSSNSYLVPVNRRLVRDNFYKHGSWGNPDHSYAVDMLRWLWNNFGTKDVETRVRQAYAKIATNFNFYETANVIKGLLLA